MKRSSSEWIKIIALPAAAWVAVHACIEFFYVAWGTGAAIGRFSPRWFALFVLYALLCAVFLTGAALALLRPERFEQMTQPFIRLRSRFSFLRWALVFFVLVFPAWFLQRTMWGIVFDGFYFRAMLWACAIFLVSSLLTRGNALIEWKPFLASLILTSSAFTIAISLQGVVDYPFSLGWSEGNRMWDYSMMFGRERYGLRPDQDVYVLLDTSRMFVGGLPFLIPNVTIEVVRLWIGLTLILPYFLAGLAAYIIANKNTRIWMLMTLWVFLFLRQGPIHAPLVLAAALTIFAWRKPFWLAIPIIIYAGYYAQASRFTWMFAPGLWIGMLELAGASLLNGKLERTHWIRAIALGAFGVFGGFILPKLMPLLKITTAPAGVAEVTEQVAEAGITPDFVTYAVTDQPLLWYRLLPNPTFETGILLGLVIAVLPIGILLVWLSASQKWILNLWQKLAIAAPLLAFLVVGLVSSAKIGGGGDLHNMDMFLIGIALTVFIAWVNGGSDVVMKHEMPLWTRLVLVAALVIPAGTPLAQLRSRSYGDEMDLLLVLTDTTEKRFLDMLPDTAAIDEALIEIQEAATYSKEFGEVLFIDQRQLLTFGYIKDIPFVGDYEKKILMNEALSTNYEYYESFYRDIASQRFSLIVVEPLRTPVKDSAFEFGEENNVWVKWVSIPVLCYYQEVQTYKEVNVMLLIPKRVPDDCSQSIPPKP
ncbi:MAG: hypothetical protein HXY38_09555 [Chloroflexi bacterium]|nr:hypothetical protein [Chloroflexota bacterium]